MNDKISHEMAVDSYRETWIYVYSG